MCEIIKRLNELTFNSKTMYLLGRAEMKRINKVISEQGAK